MYAIPIWQYIHNIWLKVGLKRRPLKQAAPKSVERGATRSFQPPSKKNLTSLSKSFNNYNHTRYNPTPIYNCHVCPYFTPAMTNEGRYLCAATREAISSATWATIYIINLGRNIQQSGRQKLRLPYNTL